MPGNNSRGTPTNSPRSWFQDKDNSNVWAMGLTNDRVTLEIVNYDDEFFIYMNVITQPMTASGWKQFWISPTKGVKSYSSLDEAKKICEELADSIHPLPLPDII